MNRFWLSMVGTFSNGAEPPYESKPRTIEAEVGHAGLISIQKIPSTRIPGKYTIRVHLTLGNVKAEGESALTVSQK